ncbi:MAG TPA: cupin domain-containing protein [Hyphomicrobiaceae bacterium]|jgi:quercetin dioxygenase-like cupin family protein|nr:cupin domain-containing protein [Hyphomicrobiaceae bacterium]
MADKGAVAKATPLTPGAKRAGPGEYYFDMTKVNSIMGGPDYSNVFGGVVEGERMIAALMRMPAGGGSVPHSHPNEQWVYVLEGTMDSTVDSQRRLVKPGEAIYIPANVVHCATATAERDVIFFTVKDASHGLHGIKHPG